MVGGKKDQGTRMVQLGLAGRNESLVDTDAACNLIFDVCGIAGNSEGADNSCAPIGLDWGRGRRAQLLGAQTQSVVSSSKNV